MARTRRSAGAARAAATARRERRREAAVTAGRSVLVLGGTGGVGEGIVDALLERGTFERVIVSSRDDAKLDTLRRRTNAHPALVTLPGSVDDFESARRLLAATLAYGPLGAVVASLGGWWSGPELTALDERQWHDGIATFLTPHFVAARTFVPALEIENARYLLIGGGAATVPVPHAALVSIGGAAQIMLARTLVAERSHQRFPIIEELVIDGPVRTNAAHHGPLTEHEITAREVGDIIATMLDDGTTGTWPGVERAGPIVTIRAAPTG